MGVRPPDYYQDEVHICELDILNVIDFSNLKCVGLLEPLREISSSTVTENENK